MEPLLALWTINRLLKRYSLVAKPSYQPRGTPYPTLAAPRPNTVHQLDVVGPSDLHSEQRFHGIHLIDVHSNAVALAAPPSKQVVDVVEVLVAAWQELDIPRNLHVDNELAFRGSNRHPRSFGLLIRVCLPLRIAVHCIPEAEPWRNGIVERCNDVDDKLCFRPQQLRYLAHVREELPRFEAFHNT